MLRTRRLAAFIIDYSLASLIMSYVLTNLGYIGQGFAPVAIVGFFAILNFVQYCWFGKTTGERLLKIGVVAEDQQTPSIMTYFYRSVGALVGVALPILNLPFLMPSQRTVADRISQSHIEFASKRT